MVCCCCFAKQYFLVGVELNTESQIPYNCGLGIGVIVSALGTISWDRNLEELPSCYVSTVQFDYLLFQKDRSRVIQLCGNPAQAFWADRQNFPWQEGYLQSRSRAYTGRVQERVKAECRGGTWHSVGQPHWVFGLKSSQNLLNISEIILNWISEDIILQGSHLIIDFLL